jgi:hypothetical protein
LQTSGVTHMGSASVVLLFLYNHSLFITPLFVPFLYTFFAMVDLALFSKTFGSICLRLAQEREYCSIVGLDVDKYCYLNFAWPLEEACFDPQLYYSNDHDDDEDDYCYFSTTAIATTTATATTYYHVILLLL